MLSLRPCKSQCQSTFPPTITPSSKLHQRLTQTTRTLDMRRKVIRCASTSHEGGGESKTQNRRTFLTIEEAGLVEISGLSPHERFLCRLTISSLNLLRVISEQEGCSIEELNAGKVCDWFVKDKLKREQNLDSAVLQWDDSDLQL
ncbi:uncharacterized protein LOC133788984 [Humulus lupulus]|uniref:uncharacterized protein LOC133788984 n=1 Tax=Humulus lupulus TaxID=3486 RepID=UPI002B405646|nr:uncharacterized protein LOC133788984 [Humulus lupulus]